MHIRTIIVDDEGLARKRLRKLLQKYQSELEIIAEAQNGEEAVEKISALRPEVIFLDVQMPGYDGFEVVRRLRTKPFIVFVTAYNEYALKAFEENSVDYLLKPIEQKRLDKAVEKLRRLFDSSKLQFNENIERMLSQLVSPSLQRMKVKIGEKILLLDLSDVVYFEAKDKYTFLHTSDREYMIDETITDLEVKLDKSNFIRIHRAIIVNVKFIRELVKWFAGRYKAKLKDKRETELIVSRRYADQIRHL
jgi:two-component system LytT family response regulator